MKRLRAFTLIEILVVIVLLGVLSSLALVGYNKAVRKSYEREAVNQLMTIHTANELFHNRTGQYLGPTGSWVPLAQVNSGLGLNIVTNGPLSYRYWRAGVSQYQAYADYAGNPSFTIQIEQGNTTWTFSKLSVQEHFRSGMVGQLAALLEPIFDFMVPDAEAIITYNNPCCSSVYPNSCPTAPVCPVIYH